MTPIQINFLPGRHPRVATWLGLWMVWLWLGTHPSAALIITNQAQLATITNPPSVSAKDAQAAAERGVAWLAANKDRMTLSFALKTYEKIHRVTANPDLRQQLAALIKEKSAALPTKAPTIDPAHPESGNWYELRPAIMDLIYLKSLNQPWESEAEKLKQLFRQHGENMLPAQVNLSEKLVAAYKLQLLGVPTQTIYSNTLAAIRAQGLAVRPGLPRPDLGILYARTHVLFTASGYYARYLSAADFQPELECFDTALKHFAHWPELDHGWADIASELLIGRKLLRQPSTPEVESMRWRLLLLQNPDGSWGGRNFNNTKVHNTVMATIALLDFAAEFKICVDYL